jgi:hypothetical protein
MLSNYSFFAYYKGIDYETLADIQKVTYERKEERRISFKQIGTFTQQDEFEAAT